MKNNVYTGMLKTVLLALLTSNAMATDYYFDSNAASTGSGTLATPFKSLTSMPTLASGDVIKLAKGSEWENARIAVTTDVTITSYGEHGAKPVLDGSILRSYSDSGLAATEVLDDPGDPDSGIITFTTASGIIVGGVFINEAYPLYVPTDDTGAKPMRCNSAAARQTPRFSFANNKTKICRASLPAGTTIDDVRLVTRERIIDLSIPTGTHLETAQKTISISGLDIRYAQHAGIGGQQNVPDINYGTVLIQGNDFHGIINTSVCLCSAAPNDAGYLTQGDKFEKLKVSGNRFYSYGREAVYVGTAVSLDSFDALPIEIVDNIFGEPQDTLLDDERKYLISGWNQNTDSGSEGVDIKRGNGWGLVARNVFLLNMKKTAVFVQSYAVEVSRNTIYNTFEHTTDVGLPRDRNNAAIVFQIEPPPGTTVGGGGGLASENTIVNGAASGILFRGANGIEAWLDSNGNQILLADGNPCPTPCQADPAGNSAFMINAHNDYTFSATDNVVRGGNFAIHWWINTPIDPITITNTFRGSASGYCLTPNLPSPGSYLDASECLTGVQYTDGDAVADLVDKCPAVSDPDQADTDENGIGDACDLAWQSNDTDADGIYNTDDNCPSTANPDQIDLDQNGVGDTCDHGLTATYFNDSDTTLDGTISQADDKLVDEVLTRIEPNIDFYHTGSPAPGVASDYFSARFTGRLIVPSYTGSYSFCLTGDDGVRLWINGVDLFENDHWIAQDSVRACATVSLTAGQSVPIVMEFFDLEEEAIAKLEWSWPGQSVQTVPSSSLYAQ